MGKREGKERRGGEIRERRGKECEGGLERRMRIRGREYKGKRGIES